MLKEFSQVTPLIYHKKPNRTMPLEQQQQYKDSNCIVLYPSIYIAPLNIHRQTEALYNNGITVTQPHPISLPLSPSPITISYIISTTITVSNAAIDLPTITTILLISAAAAACFINSSLIVVIIFLYNLNLVSY